MIAAVTGWIGTLGTISAYVMLSRGYLHAASLRYVSINFVGGLLGATASAAYSAWPSVASNLIWAGVAAHTCVMELRRRRALPRPEVPEDHTILDEVDVRAELPTEPVADTLVLEPALAGVSTPRR
ncbi:hypothetical protein J2X46_003767 [Nocardioides sp. BE266]|uniref:hypothetical protein n=1 Tax=Nocardioides sp. BE266 TaxID=2817725 RepID=UPI0028658E25|nr:hypothetical protein [Nocardioides sp. BE266]MDR7254769.1 hypothetical protein [Nocardioides sp. BE266]